ncbi:MAG: histidinol dehydrogenase, partial [Candidatus Omnitrophica bacterium]|nr:histidinol dehydrogenase [Candidatus Omnitrophota bacterium]
MKVIKANSREFERICNRSSVGKKRIQKTVARIVEDVQNYGDDALIKYVKQFDKVPLPIRQLRIKEDEINRAYRDLDPKFITTLKIVIENINKFYRKELKKTWRMSSKDGIKLSQAYQPIERVGVYVPAGTAPLVSTVYMTVVPARIAGVKKIVILTPADKFQKVDPHILVVANLLKVDEIYKVGGAQAIAAMAFGTKTIPKVDKIVGPGNEYVTEAKRQVFGYVDIDMLAGPSEVVVVANQFSNPNYVVADLRAQAEHHGGLAVLITSSRKLAQQVRKQIKEGYIIIVKNMEQAAHLTNLIAPEHLQIMIKSPNGLIKKINKAGAIFTGSYTPTALGDYIAGPSHVLPTGGTARFFSGLGVDDFIKKTHIVSYTKKALEKVKDRVEMLSEIEGLKRHSESIKIRFE